VRTPALFAVLVWYDIQTTAGDANIIISIIPIIVSIGQPVKMTTLLVILARIATILRRDPLKPIDFTGTLQDSW
jgi:hypothetical protein